jgi:hypothetical protein
MALLLLSAGTSEAIVASDSHLELDRRALSLDPDRNARRLPERSGEPPAGDDEYG